MEMTLPSSMCLNITCRGFGVDNYAAGCAMFMHLCMRMQEHCSLKQILHWRLYTHCNILDVKQNQTDTLVNILQKVLFADTVDEFRIMTRINKQAT